MERFLKEKRKGKRFLYFYDYVIKLNLPTIRMSPAKEVVVGLLVFLIV